MHHKKFALLVGSLIIALGAFGCLSSSSQATPTRLPAAIPPPTSEPSSTPIPTEIPIVDLDLNEVCSHGEGKISTTGFLYLPSSVTVIGKTYYINLVENVQAPFVKENAVELLVNEGNGPNQMQPLPDNFVYSDLQVNTEDGAVATHGTQVRITASFLMMHPSGTGCSVGLIHFYSK